MRGRQSKVLFNGALSTNHNIRVGVPQGAVTSPILFNYYLTKLPLPPDGIYIIQYADDISIYTSGTNIEDMTNRINKYAEEVISFLAERELKVSPEKSTTTLFTPDTREVYIHPQVMLNGQLVPLERNPKLLGVIYDPMFTFSKHVTTTVDKAKKKINIIKSLAGTSWGADKETLELTYKSIVRSGLEYGVPIWGPIISTANWTKLQTVQNQGLKITTGNHVMASKDHIHQETKILPLKEHGDLLTKQFHLNCHLPGHPGNKHLNKPAQPRSRKLTARKYQDSVVNLLPITDKKNLKKKMRTVHTDIVATTINSYNNNRVLNTKPPGINKEEISLNRKVRSRLSQLRSGFSICLNDYKHRLDPEVLNQCPKCGHTPHDTNHLFNCTEDPTDLQTINLWTTPILAANFLKLDEGVT